MSDTTILPPPAPAAAPPAEIGPTVRPRRQLPGGRAVVGAFLMIVAAVGTFGAYLQATAEPTSRYLVAVQPLTEGEIITADDLSSGTRFDWVPLDLPPAQAAALYVEDTTDRDTLLGMVVAAPVAAGDLVRRSAVLDPADAEGVAISFSLPADRALNGSVKPTERVDVIATFPSQGASASETRVVARQVRVLHSTTGTEGIGGGRIGLTVLVDDLAAAQALQHAVDVADVAVVRGGDAEEAAPAPTRSDAAPRSATQRQDATEDDTQGASSDGGA